MVVEINWHKLSAVSVFEDVTVMKIEAGKKVNVKNLKDASVLLTIWEEKDIKKKLKIDKMKKIKFFSSSIFEPLSLISDGYYSFICINLNKFKWKEKEILWKEK